MKEQMVLILRFVDKNNIIREEFTGFLKSKNNMTGVELNHTINEHLGSVDLDILDCRIQGYDGASAVAGKGNRL